MRIAIIALGTQGDVQPYIALGKGLKKAGNIVRLVTHQNFDLLVNSHGLEFWSLKDNVQRNVIQSKELPKLLEKGNFLGITLQMAKKAQHAACHWTKESLAACRGMDMVIAGIGGLYLGLSLAEKLELPFIQAYVVPFTPTKTFPSVLLPKSLSKLGSFFNRFSHHLTRQIMWQGFRSADRLARQQVLGLPVSPFWGPYNSDLLHRYPILYGFSQSVIPKPSDWNNAHVTGYWFLDSASNWTPSKSLMEFLERGLPPIYIGFGSMSNRKPEETVDLFLQALERTKQRAIILSGWGGLRKENLPDTVLMVDSIPHSWLFPRVKAVVHHGGAGTTAAAFRAGVPSIVIPFFGDQFFWGQRVAELGVGLEPIPRKKLTVELLAQAIQKVLTDQTICQRAANLGSKIQAEDGIADAIAVIQNIE